VPPARRDYVALALFHVATGCLGVISQLDLPEFSEEMLMHLNGQIALVIGGSKGLGRAFAGALAEAGVGVAVTARHEGELSDTVAEIEERGGRGFAFPADVTDGEAVARLVTEVEKNLGRVDLLVNNAGSLRAFGRLAEADPSDWWREVEINLRGPFLCARAVLSGMIERRRGRIINVASAAGLEPIEAGSAYCVSKTALIRLSEQLALETQEWGVSVFAIHPGTVRTPMNAYVHDSELVGQRAPKVQTWFRQLYAEGRDTPVEEPVRLLLELASGRADALSGCYLDVRDDLDALLRRAKDVQREQKQRLRLVT
jgi:NAD(P)-dependent dehydrogenase (short-subunit alcohol dehydrogenase family)